MVPALGLCFLSGVSRPRIFPNSQVMEELCLRAMGALLKWVLASFWRGCPKWTPPSSRKDCASQENWERSLASKAGWLSALRAAPTHLLPGEVPFCALMGGWVETDRLLPLARLTLKSTGSLWTCT